MSLGDALQQVAWEMAAAALPDASLQLAADRLGEAGVGVRDHQPDATQAPFLEMGDELRPEGLGLAVADLEAQQLPATILVHPHGDDDSAGAELLSLAQPPLEVGGIEIDVGVAAALQGPAQKRLHLLVDLLTDATHLRLGDAALGAERRHQGIDLAGRDPTDVSLHDHRVQGLINPAAGFEDRGEEAARAQFRDLQCQIPHLGGQGARPVAVAVAEPLIGALVPIRTEEGSELQLNQLLQAVACQFRDQLSGTAAIE